MSKIVYIYQSNDVIDVELHLSKIAALKSALVDINSAFEVITDELQTCIDGLKEHGRFYHDGVDICIMSIVDKRGNS